MVDLATELISDSLARGYSIMTDLEAADDLNTSYRSRNRTSMTGDEVFQSIESQTIWDGLTANQRLEFLALCGRDILDPFGAANVDLVKSIFGPTSDTVTALNVARVESITRAQELRDADPVFPVPVFPRHVTAARM